MTISELDTNQIGFGSLFRMLPSLNDLLLNAEFRLLLQHHPRSIIVRATRETLARIKREIVAGEHTAASLVTRVTAIATAVQDQLTQGMKYSLRPVINATGVILHTNLGRAPLSQSALNHIVEVAQGYSNLEMDLETGERSRRDDHVEPLLLRLLAGDAQATSQTGEVVEKAVVVVNNCAAATFLALNTLAEGAEVVVSRGELVEIGGGFRIPEILAKSGAQMREVGTTNRTRVSDYESTLSAKTALILRVHQSNFRIEGFTERPTLEELMSLAKRCGVPVFEDQGTGLIFSLDPHGIRTEESFTESFRRGTDIIAASGDKLLGGPQCGILVGRKDLIDRIRRNPLLRAFRVDKLMYAALEATLMEHLSEKADSIPLLRMLNAPIEEILERCQNVARLAASSRLTAEVIPVTSLIGGGTTPGTGISSAAVSLVHRAMAPHCLLYRLRSLEPPIIGRVSDNRVLLDLRTVDPSFDKELIELLKVIASE